MVKILMLAILGVLPSVTDVAWAADSASSNITAPVGFMGPIASGVKNSAIPNCGPGNALASEGSGFTCMTPAQGATGPAGANGAAGAQGPQGLQGIQGPAGGGGSVNVSCNAGVSAGTNIHSITISGSTIYCTSQ